jgi:hypothetical protein
MTATDWLPYCCLCSCWRGAVPEFAYSLLLKTFMQASLLFLAPLLLLSSLLLLGVPAVAGISALDNFSDILCGGIYCVPPVIADVSTIAIIIPDLFLLLISTVAGVSAVVRTSCS